VLCGWLKKFWKHEKPSPDLSGLFYLSIFVFMKRACHLVLSFPREALVWTAGLIALACYTPSGTHISLCPLYQLGFDFCPGCGLGRSISFLFHGDIAQSFRIHPLGIFAVIVLSVRVYTLSKLYIQFHGQNY
jgi:hypothetical protein